MNYFFLALALHKIVRLVLIFYSSLILGLSFCFLTDEHEFYYTRAV